MKKIINIVVAVVTCFCILSATTLSVFADTVSDENVKTIDLINCDGDIVCTINTEDFNIDDYVIPYDVYYNNYSISTYNAAAGVLGFSGGIAWSSAFAEAGAAFGSGGPWLLGLLLISGAVVYSANGIYKVLTEDVPEVYKEYMELVHGNLSEESKEELEEGFENYQNGEDIHVSKELSDDVANVMNSLIETDSNGNVVDTSVSVSEDILGGVFSETFSSSISLSLGEELMTLPYSKSSRVVYSATADDITWQSYIRSSSSDTHSTWYLKLSNDVTGAWIDLSQLYYRGNKGYSSYISVLSKFYQYDPGDGVNAPYWLVYAARNKNFSNGVEGSTCTAGVVNPLTCSEDYPITFGGTNTVLDNQSIVSVEYDTENSTWLYVSADGDTLSVPVDPIGLILSKTGVNSSVSEMTVVQPKGEDEDVFITPLPFVPSAKDSSIGIPISDSLYNDAQSQTNVDTQTAVDEAVKTDENVDLTTSTNIEAFLGGIVDFFGGIFDWLPDDFRDKLDGVLLTLQGIILLMAAVKIVDILWP